MSKFSLILVLSLLLAGSAAAIPIDNLCSTGWTSGCNALFTPGSIDPNYFLISDPDGVRTPAASTYITSNGSWVNPSPGSALWIQPAFSDGSALTDVKNGNFVFRTSFDLPLDLLYYDVRIVGIWMADNAGVAIRLNGSDTGNSFGWSGPGGNEGFQNPHPFTIIGRAHSGTNTLDFEISNGVYPDGSRWQGEQSPPTEEGVVNPSGLRVEFTETSLVPEPAASFLVGGALVGIALMLKRRTRA